MRLGVLFIALSLGCAPGGPPVHTVRGKVVLPGGDVGLLAGHHVEAALVDDPAVTASGVIGPDGTFTLETLHAGRILRGAREGAYRVRIYPADEDEAGRRRPPPPVAARYLDFESSGLTLAVPPAGEVVLDLTGS